MLELRASAGRVTFWPPLRTILSPAGVERSPPARPGAGSAAGAVVPAAWRVHGLVDVRCGGRRDLAPDQGVRRRAAAPGEQESGGGHERGHPDGERACRVHRVPVPQAVAGSDGGRCRLVPPRRRWRSRVHALEHQRQDDQRDADRAEQVDRRQAQVVARALGRRADRGPPRARAPASWSGRTGVPAATLSPTVTASMATSSTVTGSAVRARMPSLDRLTAVPVIVVAASASIPVSAAVDVAADDLRAGREVADRVVLDPVRRRSLMTTPGGAGGGHQAVLAAAELQPRSPRRCPRRARPGRRCASRRRPRRRGRTSWPPIATPATRAPSIVELLIVAPLVVFSTTIPRRPPVIVHVLQRRRWWCSRA